jgi:hypothetical protein
MHRPPARAWTRPAGSIGVRLAAELADAANLGALLFQDTGSANRVAGSFAVQIPGAGQVGCGERRSGTNCRGE